MTILWPTTLVPAQILANPVPFTRSGGRSLGGIERVTRTDRGWWSVSYKGVLLQGAASRRTWNALRTYLGGMAGSIAVPVWSFDSNGEGGPVLTTHSDGSIFSDGSSYAQPTITVEMAVAAEIGDTSVSLRIIDGIDDLVGVRFSYQHALYETGISTSVVGAVWTVSIFPAIRADIPADAALEFDVPTCLVRLATDREMDVSLTAGLVDKVDVAFIEDCEFWNDLAMA